MHEEHLEQAVTFLKEHSVPMVLLDAPESEHFTVMPALSTVTDSQLAYLRLHGRNERGYITGKSVAERFDYDYSADELAGIAERVSWPTRQADDVHAAFNNNRSHYAPKAAAHLTSMLKQ